MSAFDIPKGKAQIEHKQNRTPALGQVCFTLCPCTGAPVLVWGLQQLLSVCPLQTRSACLLCGSAGSVTNEFRGSSDIFSSLG